MDHLKAKIREIPDFPKQGILFYDITTLLCDAQGFRDTVDALAAPYMGEDIDQVIGIESRGFILGAAVANALGCGFVPVRKPGKLPGATHQGGLQPRVRRQRARDSPGRVREPAADPDRRRCARDGRHGQGDHRSGAQSGRQDHRHLVFDRAGFSERPLEIGGRAGLFCVAVLRTVRL